MFFFAFGMEWSVLFVWASVSGGNWAERSIISDLGHMRVGLIREKERLCGSTSEFYIAATWLFLFYVSFSFN